MRGKFITTNLKLAVLAKGKKTNLLEVKETKASIENFEMIWSKDMFGRSQAIVKNSACAAMQLV